MSAVARLNDPVDGHPGYNPTVINSSSGSVMAEGIGVARVGDTCSPHHNDQPVTHTPVLVTGSGTVFANGQALGNVGSSVDCGAAVVSGAGTVFAG